jgi:hypothetical protein
LRKKGIGALKRTVDVGLLDKIKTNFGAVDIGRMDLIAVDQDMSFPDSISVCSVSMGWYLYAFK